MATPSRVAANQLRRAFAQATPRSSNNISRTSHSVGLVACPALKLSENMTTAHGHCAFHSTASQRPTTTTVCAQKRSYSSRPSEAEHHHHVRPKVTLATLRKLYKRREPITVMTAHDFPTGTLVDKAGIDMTLVGDSLAMVALGYTSTSDLTLDEMLHHCRAVARGTRSSFLVADMPFGTYETSPEQAIANAVRILKEGKAEAVKLEGGRELAATIARLTKVGVPVLGHIGLTPQRQASLGGYKVQGKTMAKAIALMQDALALQEAGCYGIVLEAVPEPVARHITSILSIPTIGIGAGAGCSGQVLVQQDMLGLYGRVPRFCKTYRNLADEIVGALKEYSADVKSGAFPAEEHCYPMPQEELVKFMRMVGQGEAAAKATMETHEHKVEQQKLAAEVAGHA